MYRVFCLEIDNYPLHRCSILLIVIVIYIVAGSPYPQSPRYGQQSPHGNSQGTPTNVQCSPGNPSNSPRYGGQQGVYSNSPNTPRSNQPTSIYGNQRGANTTPSNKSQKGDNLVSPDYWLQGQYAGKNNFHTPQPQPRRQILQHSPGNQQQHSAGNQQHGAGNQQQHGAGNQQQHGAGNQQQHGAGNRQHGGVNQKHSGPNEHERSVVLNTLLVYWGKVGINMIDIILTS